MIPRTLLTRATLSSLFLWSSATQALPIATQKQSQIYTELNSLMVNPQTADLIYRTSAELNKLYNKLATNRKNPLTVKSLISQSNQVLATNTEYTIARNQYSNPQVTQLYQVAILCNQLRLAVMQHAPDQESLDRWWPVCKPLAPLAMVYDNHISSLHTDVFLATYQRLLAQQNTAKPQLASVKSRNLAYFKKVVDIIYKDPELSQEYLDFEPEKTPNLVVCAASLHSYFDEYYRLKLKD
ncbi:hypothetical protein CKF58_01700 [Psittacicella hinzii]|uniref:Uncharacterized protein n=1 Tax=Psittacicella hinzii TaxID=2028575 RepID=A0A3A1YUD9_9GAMM|nr:hypothetical protein CKF58_01700 [Psittacicella hinzii]